MDDTTKLSQTSLKKVEANRRNAKRSTGPRTERGKRFSRQNALKHGLLAREAVLADIEYGESMNVFTSTQKSFFDHYQPEGPIEAMLVDRIVESYWRLKRVARAERGLLASQIEESTNSKIRFNSATDGSTTLINTANLNCIPDNRNYQRLVTYEGTIERQLYKALNHLERLQRQRLGEVIPAPISIELNSQG